MRKCIVLSLFIFKSVCLLAQSLPRIIPPNPAAMQYQKYGDYPVSNFTGVPDITIPLYTIKEGDIEIPITLSYHASGVKLSDPNGAYGVGWVLNTGGIITRTQLSGSDESPFPSGYTFPTDQYVTNLVYGAPFASTTYDTLAIINSQDCNTEPDIFSYNFLGHNGKFIAKNYRSLGTPEFLQLDYKPFSIKANPQSGFRFGTFDIIDEDGRKYYFEVGGSGGSATSGISSWSLSSLTSAVDVSNVVNYSYSVGPLENITLREDIYIRDDLPNAQYVIRPECEAGWFIEDIANYMDDPETRWTYPDELSTSSVPSVISFRSGEVRFTYNAQTKRLSGMEVYNKANELIKKIEFTIYQKSAQLYTRAFLKEIKFFDASGAFINKYAFNYINEDFEMPPGYVSTDFWGYYNGPLNQYDNLIPKYTYEFHNYIMNFWVTVGANLRQTSEEDMKIYSLNEIIYPTGGKTVFEFEANEAITAGRIPNYFTSEVGGLRIKRKLNYTQDGKLAEVRAYRYSYGEMDIYPAKEYFSYSLSGNIIDDKYMWETFRRLYVHSTPTVNIAPHGSPVVYPSVTEKLMGPDYLNDGQPLEETTYEYDYKPYGYTFPTTNGASNDGMYALYKPYENLIQAHNDGKLVAVHKNNTSTFYEYEDIPGESVYGFHSEKFVFYIDNPCPCAVAPCLHGSYDSYVARKGSTYFPWNYGDVEVKTGRKRIKSVITVTHADDQGAEGESEILSSYIYDNPLHDQPTKIIVKNSKGETIETRNKYPHDYPAQEPYATMVNRHMWSPIIEETKVKAPSIELTKTKTNFGFWSGTGWSGNATNLILPQSVETKTQGYIQEERMRFDSYDDRANVTGVSKNHDMKMSYIYGYNKLYPIAEVTNASSEQVAYTSFEDNELGNWSLKPGSSVSGNNIITGKKACSGGVIKAVPVGNYVVSLWASGNCMVNGQQGKQVAVSKRNAGWRCLEWELNNVNSVDITGDNIDEVRLYPADAQMTTYTFDPLIGMTSKTDANNRISYFEYDAAWRLQHIRDDGFNILKKYQYTFLDNSENTGVNRVPLWQYNGVTRILPCTTDNTFSSGLLESEQVDNNPNSATYGKKRYVDASPGHFPASDWQFTNNYRCKTEFGEMTGEREREQKNMNPCSSYGSTRWIVVETNSPVCPRPAEYRSPALVNGEYYSTQCNTPGEEPVLYLVSFPEGQFTSTISVQDAINKMNAYAQSLADANGQCRKVPIDLIFQNNSSVNSTERFNIYMTNVNTGTSYTFENVQFNRTLGPIEQGVYEISIFPESYSETFPIHYYYSLGCLDPIYDGELSVSNVPLNYGCNTITVND